MYNMESGEKTETEPRGEKNMLYLEKMAVRQITSANYITSVNGMIHPNRVLPEHDFLYMLDGEWEVYEEGKAYQLHTDDLLILTGNRHHYGEKLCNPGNRHMYFHVLQTEKELQSNDSSQCGSETAECRQEICGQKNSEAKSCAPENGADRTQNQENVPEQHALAACATLIHCQHHPQVRRYFQELISEYWSQNPVRKERLSLYFNMILCELIALQEEQAGNGEPEPMLDEVREQIQSNPQIFYTPKEMAAHFFVCARTLNNHFQRACGKTFSGYQMDLKLDMVREFLLHHPEATLHEVALNFGFYDEFHLSKSFRKKYGQSPSFYRKKAR